MPVKQLKAIIFDMDGVLVNTEPHHIILEKKLFERLGLQIGEEEHQSFLGKSTRQMWIEIAKNHDLHDTAGRHAEENRKEIIRHFTATDEIEIMPGIKSLLERINTKEIPVALASSSIAEVVELILSKTGLKEYFRHIVSLEAVGKSKPEPDIYLYTARLLKVSPVECLVIEDSPNGIKAAKAAGMTCIAYGGEKGQADELVNDFFSIEPIIKKYMEF